MTFFGILLFLLFALLAAFCVLHRAAQPGTKVLFGLYTKREIGRSPDVEQLAGRAAWNIFLTAAGTVGALVALLGFSGGLTDLLRPWIEREIESHIEGSKEIHAAVGLIRAAQLKRQLVRMSDTDIAEAKELLSEFVEIPEVQYTETAHELITGLMARVLDAPGNDRVAALAVEQLVPRGVPTRSWACSVLRLLTNHILERRVIPQSFLDAHQQLVDECQGRNLAVNTQQLALLVAFHQEGRERSPILDDRVRALSPWKPQSGSPEIDVVEWALNTPPKPLGDRPLDDAVARANEQFVQVYGDFIRGVYRPSPPNEASR